MCAVGFQYKSKLERHLRTSKHTTLAELSLDSTDAEGRIHGSSSSFRNDTSVEMEGRQCVLCMYL